MKPYWKPSKKQYEPQHNSIFNRPSDYPYDISIGLKIKKMKKKLIILARVESFNDSCDAAIVEIDPEQISKRMQMFEDLLKQDPFLNQLTFKDDARFVCAENFKDEEEWNGQYEVEDCDQDIDCIQMVVNSTGVYFEGLGDEDDRFESNYINNYFLTN